jgi:hypothetical protein
MSTPRHQPPATHITDGVRSVGMRMAADGRPRRRIHRLSHPDRGRSLAPFLRRTFDQGIIVAALLLIGTPACPVRAQTIDPTLGGGAITPCPEDLNGDGAVDLADLGIILASYGVDDGGDIDGDGDTDLADIGLLLARYGEDCATDDHDPGN